MVAKNQIRLRTLAIVLGISALGLATVVGVMAVTGMDLPTLFSSFTVNHVTVAELQQGKLKPVLLIDVRSPEEYDEDRIGKSPLVPLTDLEAGIGIERILTIVKKSTKPNQTQPTVVLYCTKGTRSTKAYKILENSGLKMAVLTGGFTAWRKAVLPEKDTSVLKLISFQSEKLP